MTKATKELADALFPDFAEEEIEESVLDIPANQRRLITSTVDFSVSTIADYLEKGTIKIPDYQRRYIWTGAKPSRLIESLVIQCPIPVIYLHRAADETLEVIDGNQRFTTIRRFLADEFQLKGLTAFPELVGSAFSTLDQRIQRHIINRTLRCIIIEKETHPQIKFDVFERLNSGSVPLSAQELRHGLYHGRFMGVLEEMAKKKDFIHMTGLGRDHRMKREELVLRFFALRKNWRSYKKPLSAFLNSYAETYKTLSDVQKKEHEQEFLMALDAAASILGEHAFRLETETTNGKLVRKFNSAYYDAIMVGLAEGNPSRLTKLPATKKRSIKVKIEDLARRDSFLQLVVRATSDEKSVRERIRQVSNIVNAA